MQTLRPNTFKYIPGKDIKITAAFYPWLLAFFSDPSGIKLVLALALGPQLGSGFSWNLFRFFSLEIKSFKKILTYILRRKIHVITVLRFQASRWPIFAYFDQYLVFFFTENKIY